MSPTPPDNDDAAWQAAIAGARALKQDKITAPPPKRRSRRPEREQETLADPVSDIFDPFLDEAERHDLRWFSTGLPSAAVRRLKRGELQPEYTLDLHGRSVMAAKEELLRFLVACAQEDVRVVRIMHGRGTGKIAEALNRWLRQHPQVLGYHPAPLHLGAIGAVIVLLRAAR